MVCRKGAHVSPGKLPLCCVKRHPFHMAVLWKNHSFLSVVWKAGSLNNIYLSATDASGWRQALEPPSKVLMQQRGTGFHICFCPQDFLLGSQEQPITELLASQEPKLGLLPPPKTARVHLPRMLLQEPTGQTAQYQLQLQATFLGYSVWAKFIPDVFLLLSNWVIWSDWPGVWCWLSAERVIFTIEFEFILPNTQQ